MDVLAGEAEFACALLRSGQGKSPEVALAVGAGCCFTERVEILRGSLPVYGGLFVYSGHENDLYGTSRHRFAGGIGSSGRNNVGGRERCPTSGGAPFVC